MTKSKYRCGNCGESGHNRATCPRNAVPSTEAERFALLGIKAMLPMWVAAQQRITDAAARIEALTTPELVAAQAEMLAASQAVNEQGQQFDRLIRGLSPEKFAALDKASQESFAALAHAVDAI